MHRRALFLLPAALLAVASLSAQEPELEGPDGWTHRFDRGGSEPADLEFVSMPPGFHVTTGPAVILYHPDSVATGAGSELDVDGIVGLRVNHALNIHVTGLRVTPGS